MAQTYSKMNMREQSYFEGEGSSARAPGLTLRVAHHSESGSDELFVVVDCRALNERERDLVYHYPGVLWTKTSKKKTSDIKQHLKKKKKSDIIVEPLTKEREISSTTTLSSSGPKHLKKKSDIKQHLKKKSDIIVEPLTKERSRLPQPWRPLDQNI